MLLIVYYIFDKKTGFIVYDDGCHLKRFATNPLRRSLTPTAKKIAETTIAYLPTSIHTFAGQAP
jgi:hypothetical protein